MRTLPTKSLILTACALLGASSLAQAADCGAVAAAAATLAAPRITLQAAAAGNDMEPDLAAPVAEAIVSLKRQLTALIDAQAACLAADAAPDPRAIENALREAINTKPEAAFAPSAATAAVNAKSAAAAADDLALEARLLHDGQLLSITARLAIPCGSDALWLLYARGQQGWRRVLRWTSPRYARIDGAWDNFQFAVSPRTAGGSWFAAASSIRPWCSSSWSVIDYAVLRPAGAEAPQVLLRQHDSIWWGGDDLGRLTADAGHVELRFHAASIDSGVHNREFIRRYEVDKTTVQRVAPVAANARDFVDEWLVSPWAVARNWSSPTRLGLLQRSHAAVQAARAQAAGLEFGSLAACGGGAVQVELRRDDASAMFFRVASRGEAQLLDDIRAEADPDCANTLPAPAEDTAGG